MAIVKCDNCKKEMDLPPNRIKRSKRHFCSIGCKNKGLTYTTEEKTKLCKNCNNKFVYTSANKKQKFCSKKCSEEFVHKQNIVETNCDFCSKKIEVIKSVFNRNKNNFCSRECKHKHHSKTIIGEKNPNYNENLTEEDRVYFRCVDDYKSFIKQVYTRDKYSCQLCGDKAGNNLVAHHLDGYNWCKEKRTDIDNGITLCEKCHKEFHKIYGYGNNTKEQFKEYNKSISA